MRQTLKTLFLVLLAVAAFSSVGEAAPKRTVRHRTGHSSRVAPGARVVKKKVLKSRRRAHRAPAPRKHRAPAKRQ
jgi:hypothetical protein